MTTALRELTAAARERLNADHLPALAPWFDVHAVAHRRLRVAWAGRPTEDAVREHLADLLTGQDVTLVLARRPLWACGRLHDDAEAAWTAHEGADGGNLSWRCGCGAVEADGDICRDREIGPGEAPSCCVQYGEHVLTASTRYELEAAGETFESSCTPGEYVPCPRCGGYGALLDVRTAARSDCPGCDGQRVYDLADPEDQARYAAAVELAMQVERKAAKNRALPKPWSLP